MTAATVQMLTNDMRGSAMLAPAQASALVNTSRSTTVSHQLSRCCKCSLCFVGVSSLLDPLDFCKWGLSLDISTAYAITVRCLPLFCVSSAMTAGHAVLTNKTGPLRLKAGAPGHLACPNRTVTTASRWAYLHLDNHQEGILWLGLWQSSTGQSDPFVPQVTCADAGNG